jgi:hypothetical protein
MKKILLVVLLALISAYPLKVNLMKSGPAVNGSLLSIKNYPSPTLTPTPTSQSTTITPAVPNSPQETNGEGPNSYPSSINPLTGLPVSDPGLLQLPPALVSIANFPVSARPQAGLSFAPFVFEMYIGEGMTRFLAMFYGQYPSTDSSNSSQGNSTLLDKSQIGPIRSGRLPYESIRKLYSGFLVMASAYRAVNNQLNATTNIYGSDADDINSALIDVSKLKAIAEANRSNTQNTNLSGNQYSTTPPTGGSPASRLWVFYNYLNQVNWEYSEETGKYLRTQDNADGSGSFTPSTDRLTGDQLGFENVILLFAKHNVLNRAGTLIDFELLYTGNKAYLFRDGKVFPILWNTMNGDYEKKSGLLRPIRFTDQNGKPVSLKPGQTWVEIVDLSTTLQDMKSGAWKARFYAP